MSAPIADCYYPRVYAMQNLLPILSDPSLRPKLPLTEAQFDLFTSLLSAEGLPATFKASLSTLISTQMPDDIKRSLSNYVYLQRLSDLLDLPSLNSLEIYQTIELIEDPNIKSEFILELAWSKLCDDISSETTVEGLSKYVKVIEKLDSKKKQGTIDAVFLQVSHNLDITNQQLLYLAQNLKFLKDFKSDKSFNSLIETLAEQLFSKIRQIEVIDSLPSEMKGLFQIDSTNDVKSALNLIRDFSISKAYDELFEEYDKHFKAFEDLAPPAMPEPESPQKTIDPPLIAKVSEDNNLNEEVKLYYQESDTFNPKDLELNIQNAAAAILNLPINSSSQIHQGPLIWTINLPSKTMDVFKAEVIINNQPIIVAWKCNYTITKEKVLSDQAEYMAMMQDHKNFLKLYGAFWDVDEVRRKNRYNLIMEYAPETLSSRIEKWEKESVPKTIRESEALIAAKELIFGMEALNNKGISHRDIKPDNIFINEENVYKIADFDASNKYERDSLGVTITNNNASFVGTTGYISPELQQMKANKKTTARINYNKSDVYSLGLTILRMVTDKDSTAWNAYSSKLQSHINEIIDLEVSDAKLKNVLRMMLIVEHAQRPKFQRLAFEFKEVQSTYIDE